MTCVFPKLGAFPLMRRYRINTNMSFKKVSYLNKNFMIRPKTFRIIIQKGQYKGLKLARVGTVSLAGAWSQNATWLFVKNMIKRLDQCD